MRTKYTARELKKLKPGEYAVIDRGRFEVFCETNGGNLQKLRVAAKMKKEDLAEVVERIQSILFVTEDTTVDTEARAPVLMLSISSTTFSGITTCSRSTPTLKDPRKTTMAKPTKAEVQTQFKEVVKGVPNHVVCRAMNAAGSGTNWHGCTKAHLLESWDHWVDGDSWCSLKGNDAFERFKKQLVIEVDRYKEEKRLKDESKVTQERELKANLEALKKELVLANEAHRQAKALSPPTLHQLKAFDYIVKTIRSKVHNLEFAIRTHPLTPKAERYAD